MRRFLLACLWSVWIGLAVVASGAQAQTETPAPDRAATGGAQTLEDILARQRGEPVDYDFKRKAIGDPGGGAALGAQLGGLGGASDAEIWRALRYGEANVTVSSGGDVAKTLVQDGGMAWYAFRTGPMTRYGLYLLAGTIGLLALFYLLRGKVRLNEAMTGKFVTRFQAIERFAHWLLAGSFLLLGVTGLIVLLGRKFIAPALGKDINSTLLQLSKLVHNSVAWAFMTVSTRPSRT